MIKQILKRDGRIVPFNREKITFAVLQAAISVGGRDPVKAEKVTDEVVHLLEQRQREDSIPTVEEVQDLVEKALIERGHAKTAKAYIVYRYEHALKRVGRKSLTYSADNIPYDKLWEALSWAVDHGCVHLRQVSDSIREGRYQALIRDCEEFYNQELNRAVGKLSERLESVKMVIVAGPSSSGKTTTTIKVERQLKPMGQDLRGDHDFETPQALDIPLINKTFRELLLGKRVEIPFYNFKTGKREGVSGQLQLGEGEILLVDSLHGLFPEMTEGIPEEQKFRLYIETLSQIKDSNNQFIRWMPTIGRCEFTRSSRKSRFGRTSRSYRRIPC
jgi:uridine kinase